MKISHANASIYSFSIIIIFIFITVISCTRGEKGMKRSTGRTNEILVVTNNKAQWEGAIGDTLRNSLQQAVVGLPQIEPFHHLYNIPENNFENNFKKMHSIFIVNINPEQKSPSVEAKRDLWSAPQQVVKITAPNTQSFYKTFDEYKDSFLKLFNDLEIERINKNLSMATSVKLKDKLKRKFGISMDIPGGFAIAADKEGFLWLRQTAYRVKQDVEMGILIYESEYVDTLAFELENIIQRRDSLTKQYVAGDLAGSYMAVSKDIVPPISFRTSDYITDFAIETRGLWMVVNDFMGGPFLSYTFTNPENDKIITIDGYVYNPSGPKRNFIREMEAIFRTLRFTDK